MRNNLFTLMIVLFLLVSFNMTVYADEISPESEEFKELLSEVIEGKKDPEVLTDRIIIKSYNSEGEIYYNSISKYDDNSKRKASLKEEYIKSEYLQPDFIRYASYDFGEDSNLSWGKSRIGAQNLINKVGKTTNKVIVAVLDSGVDYNHHFFKGRIIEGYNFVEKNNNPMDRHSHGTHVAGIIVDSTNENVKIMPIKVLGDDGVGYDSDIANGIYYAVNNGANIINMSLGGPGHSPYVAEAIKYAISKDVLVIVAAGNESSNTKYFYPAAEEVAVVVSAIDENDNFASFSNYGDSVDICAPGVNIYSSVLNNQYKSFNGTSTSTPYITAIAALIKQEDMNRDVYMIEEILKINTDDLGLVGRDEYFGEGIINVSNYSNKDIEAEDQDFLLLDKKYNVPLDKEWTIKFNRDFNTKEIMEIKLIKDNKKIQDIKTYYNDPSKVVIKSNEVYERNSQYYIMIILTNGNKYKMEFSTIL